MNWGIFILTLGFTLFVQIANAMEQGHEGIDEEEHRSNVTATTPFSFLPIISKGDREGLKLMKSERVIKITQRDAGFTSKTSSKSAIATFSVSRCCAMATYDPTSGSISLSHFDIFTDLEDMHRLSNKICPTLNRPSVAIALVSGNQELMDKIEASLMKLGFINIKKDLDFIAQHRQGGIHIAIDGTGPEVYKSYFSISSLHSKELTKRAVAFQKRRKADMFLNFIE